MAEKVGSIFYTVSADTSELVKEEARAAKSLEKIEVATEKTDKAMETHKKTVKSVAAETEKLAVSNKKAHQSISLTYSRLESVQAPAAAAAKKMDDVADAIEDVGDESVKTSKKTKTLETEVNKATKGISRATQANIQNASFQVQDFAVQLASGQGAALALTQQLPQLLGGFGLLGAGISTVVAILGGLYLAFGNAKTNAELLEKSIEQVRAVMTVGAEGVANYTEEMQKLAELSENLAKLRLATALADQNEAIKLGIKGIQEALDSTRGSFTSYTGQIEKLLKVSRGTDGFAAAERAFRDYSSAVSTFTKSGDVGELERSLLALSEAGASNTKEGRELIRTTTDLITKFREGQITIDALNQALAGNTAEVVKNNNAINSINSALDDYLDNENEMYSSDLKDRIAAVNDELEYFLELERIRDEAQAARSRAGLSRRVESIGLTPLQDIEKRYQDELTLLQEARRQQLLTEQDFADREVQINKEKVDAIKRYQNQQAQNNKFLSQSSVDTLSSLGNAFGNFADIAAQGGKKSFENYKALASAQALISTFLAANNALATPAPFPIPQILAGSITALGLANVAQIQNQQYSGARQFGGPVTSGKSYLVGERGPEIFTPNGSGSITSNKDSFGSSGVTVNVNNYASSNLSFDVQQRGEIIDIAVRRSIDAVSNQIGSGQGKIPNAMRQSGTYRTDARR